MRKCKIEFLRKMPETFKAAVGFLRDLEDVYDKVRGSKIAAILEEAKAETVKEKRKGKDWDIIEEVTEVKAAVKRSTYKDQIEELVSQVKALSGKVDKAVTKPKKEVRKVEPKVATSCKKEVTATVEEVTTTSIGEERDYSEYRGYACNLMGHIA